MYYLPLFLLFFLFGCSSKEEKGAKQNLKGEYIYRHHNEYFFIPPPPRPQVRVGYPWEEKYIGKLPRITKEFFHCKGDPLNPVVIQSREGKDSLKYFDCQGKHGLPLREGKEFIYPCLVDLLNFIQEKTNRRVVITCGHRCPKHNAYVDYKPANWSSKHMLGAEVDFYVEGMEQEPMTIVSLLQSYYTNTSTELKNFKRYEKEGLPTSTPSWYNKEIFIKLSLSPRGAEH